MLLSLPPSNRLQSARKQTEGASGGHILLIQPWDPGERGVSARLAGDLLPLGDTGDQHQQQEPKLISEGWEMSANGGLCRAKIVRRYFCIWVSVRLMHVFYQCLHFNQRILLKSALYLISAHCPISSIFNQRILSVSALYLISAYCLNQLHI